jgi:hypothetical protein
VSSKKGALGRGSWKPGWWAPPPCPTGAAERFRREACLAAKQAHADVVGVFDSGAAGGTHFRVMEYIEGTDLARLLKDKGSPTAPGRASSDARGRGRLRGLPLAAPVTPATAGLGRLVVEGRGLVDEFVLDNVVEGLPRFAVKGASRDGRVRQGPRRAAGAIMLALVDMEGAAAEVAARPEVMVVAVGMHGAPSRGAGRPEVPRPLLPPAGPVAPPD